MVTPILIDGFEHQVESAQGFGGSHEALWFTFDGSAQTTFPSGRNGVCMQQAAAGASTRGVKHVNDRAVLVLSIYLKVISNPGSDSVIFRLQNAGFSNVANFTLLSTGVLRLQVSGTTDGPNINDGAWHRIDLRADVTTNPWVVDWQVDGSTQTQLTFGTAGTSVRYLQMGETGTWTIAWDDLVCSATSGDYPLGAHDVFYGVPTGDGTHAAGTNVIEDNAGTDIVSPNAFPLMDEWTPNTADYVRQAATGASNYAEVTFDDQPANKNIWGVEGIAALLSSNTNANNGTTRILDAASTTLTDIYAGDMSETSLHYRRAIITAPAGGWDGAGYAGVKARVGFSTDVDGIPQWSALMLQYAAVDAGAAGTVLDPFGMSGFFGS